eukprot:COSAG01_NODE_53101_length_341_cov_1.289256_1_plen_63_part_01
MREMMRYEISKNRRSLKKAKRPHLALAARDGALWRPTRPQRERWVGSHHRAPRSARHSCGVAE